MGIHNLWPFLTRFRRKVNFCEFSTKTAAIDASCWVHKALYLSMCERGGRERFASIFQGYLRAVKKAGIRPFVVFDGLPLPAKASENGRRRRERENLQRIAEEENLSDEEDNKLRGKAAEVTFEDVTSCINICRSENVKYIVSPYESDAQIAFLLANGYADFAITEDSDLLAYGCNKVMVKASINGDGDFFILSEILDGLKLSMKQFRQMCIAAGCDYLSNIRGVGIQRAFEMVASHGYLLELLSRRGASQEYKACFGRVEAVFQHQTVFNLSTCTTVPLERWETDPSSDLQNLRGNILDDSYSNNLVVGNVDTKTGKKTNSYPLFSVAVTTTEDAQGTTSEHLTTADCDGDGNECQEMQCEIIHIDRFSSFQWKIPCFPVIKLEFVRVLLKTDTEVLDGVVQKSEAPNIQRGTFKCTSHCRINMHSKNYTVLWKLAPLKTGQMRKSLPSVSCDLESEDDHESLDENGANQLVHSNELETTHCLPFKVLGTCYASSRQNALQEAYEYLNEYNRNVFVKLEAEPDNPSDKHAIAVYVMSSSNYEKVGYIAHELTKFVHPVLKDPTLNVTVKRIWFCTTFLMIGFYLTINITKAGIWDNQVVKACSKVK